MAVKNINVLASSFEVSDIFGAILTKFWVSKDFLKRPKYQISLKSPRWEPLCYMRTGRQTERHDMTKLKCAFRYLSKRVCVSLFFLSVINIKHH